MGVQLQDLNPGADHQTKAAFKPGKSSAPPAPPQEPFAPPPKAVKQRIPDRPANAVVQKVRPMPEATPERTIFEEMADDFAGAPEVEQAPVQTQTQDDPEIDTYINRFQGTEAERLRAMAKSYKSSELRMRQLENEKKIWLNGGSAPQQVQTAQPATQQVQVTPQFNYKRFEEEILDRGKGAAVAQDFEKHIIGTIKSELAGPLMSFGQELIDNKLFRKYPDVVSEDNLDMIRAMARQEQGADAWERSVKAVEKYKMAMQPNQAPVNQNDIQAMQSAAQTPTPQARPAGGKKMYRESEIRAEMQRRIRSGEYTRDNTWRTLVDRAYREGRVQRGV